MSEMKADALTLGQRIKHGWNAFLGRDQQVIQRQDLGPVFFNRADHTIGRYGIDGTPLSSIYTRISVDVSNYVMIRHCRLDDQDRFKEYIKSGLDYCLNVEANIDQTGRDFRRDLVDMMLNEGVAASVPVDTTVNPRISGSYDIQTMRVGKIVEWFPQHVKIDLYNDRTGLHENIILPKAQVGIHTNPFYTVMNEPLSIVRRLAHKLNLMDVVDEQTSSGKLDLIIQLPYTIKTDLRRQEAEKRRRDIETQLVGNKYGIAYTDGTEKVTQLNRSLENKLIEHAEFLTSMLYSRLGMTREVFEGTADERTMLNYITRTVEPFAATIAEEMNRKYLTKTARTKQQRVMYFYDVFKFATLESIAVNGSQLITTEVVTRNEVRGKLGFPPSEDPAADQLMNPNINPHEEGGMAPEEAPADMQSEGSGEPSLADMKVSEIPDILEKGQDEE